MSENVAVLEKAEVKEVPEKIETRLQIQERKPNDFQEEILPLIGNAGTIELTDKQRHILYAPVKDEDVEIRPDGLIYLPWMEYVSRLKDAFGMKWAIIPQGMPKMKDNLILWGFYLIIDGRLAGYALGEQLFHGSNATMTYGDAVEGAKSNALMRLCKGIGISLELWRPKFIRAWKEKYAEEYLDKRRNKKLWKRKDSIAVEDNFEADKTEVQTNEDWPDEKFVKELRELYKNAGSEHYFKVFANYNLNPEGQPKSFYKNIDVNIREAIITELREAGQKG